MNGRNLRLFALLIMGTTLSIMLMNSCGDINTVNDPHFDSEGYLIDTTDSDRFELARPRTLKIFTEVSGSMNGFFRANKPTKFKEDVWRILSFYSTIEDDVTIMSGDNNNGTTVSINDFQKLMNTGAFVATASTKIPEMLESITKTINPENGEVALLISDMKYSPVGNAAPEVLLTQYSSDISKLLGQYGKAICLIGATSDFVDKKGNILCEKSPYYFLLIGNQEHVAYLRNGISTMLENHERLIDNIETGFDYGKPTYSFGIPDNCFQLDNEPTFVGAEDDTCTIRLKVDIEKYRWIISHENIFPKAFKCKALYGSEVKVGNIEYQVKNINDQMLKRVATAIVELKIYNMALDSEVIEWTLELPDLDITNFGPYLNALDENDITKTYSLEDFFQGMFHGGVVNKSLQSNYILISKKS